eukprot:3407906-Pleurochrysis_carterae.AAC.1
MAPHGRVSRCVYLIFDLWVDLKSLGDRIHLHESSTSQMIRFYVFVTDSKYRQEVRASRHRRLILSAGDVATGRISRADLASLIVSVLDAPTAVGKLTTTSGLDLRVFNCATNSYAGQRGRFLRLAGKACTCHLLKRLRLSCCSLVAAETCPDWPSVSA